MFELALISLAHILVFVYWLGGDLGAFYTSRFLTRPDIPADRRLLAAKIVGDVDMAPRTALILTLPTGLALAQAKGWWVIGWPVVIAVIALSLVWLLIAWRIHLAHGTGADLLRKIDLGLRWMVALGLIGVALFYRPDGATLPAFLAAKMMILAACIFVGLAIRGVLKPLGPALGGLHGENASDAQASLAATLKRARPLVMVIWTLLLAAALLGLWTPASF
jgi:hypothetical protein